MGLLILFSLIGAGVFILGDFQRDLLLNSRFEQLTSVREALKTHVNTYQKQTKSILHSISLSSDTAMALKQLAPAFYTLQSTENNLRLDTILTDNYQTQYLNKLHQRIPNAEPRKKHRLIYPHKSKVKLLSIIT